MYLIQNIKKNILSKFVNNMICSKSAYILMDKSCIIDDMENAKDFISDIDIDNIKQKDFILVPFIECGIKVISIKTKSMNQDGANISNSCVFDAKGNYICFESYEVLLKLPNEEQLSKYSSNQLVPVQLLGYFEKWLYMLDDPQTIVDPFIKIVEPGVFDQQTILATKVEIILNNKMFSSYADVYICCNEEVDHGVLHCLSNQVIVYKPNGQSIAVVIGRINSKTDPNGNFLEYKIVIEDNLPKNLKVINGIAGQKEDQKKQIEQKKSLDNRAYNKGIKSKKDQKEKTEKDLETKSETSKKNNQSDSDPKGNQTGQSHGDHNVNKQSGLVSQVASNNGHNIDNSSSGSYNTLLLLCGLAVTFTLMVIYFLNQKEKKQQSKQQSSINNTNEIFQT